MARLLTQLFEVTGQFEMRTQPQLILLQKTMVVVEGVARSLDPAFNMWAAADPVVRTWMERKLGPIGRVEAAGGHLVTLARSLASLPQAVAGLRDSMAAPPPRDRSMTAALWVIAGVLAVIAVKLVW